MQATLRHALRGTEATFERGIIRAGWLFINNMKILYQPIHLHQAIRSPTVGQALGRNLRIGLVARPFSSLGFTVSGVRLTPKSPWTAALGLPDPSFVVGNRHRPRPAVQLVGKSTLY